MIKDLSCKCKKENCENCKNLQELDEFLEGLCLKYGQTDYWV